MDSMGKKVKQSLYEFVSAAAEKTDELAKVGVRKLDIVSLKRNIGREMAALGGRVYHLIKEEGETDIRADANVRSLIGKIETLETVLRDKEKEITEIRAAKRPTPESPGPGAE